MKNITLERLKSLPRREEVVWQAVWHVPGSGQRGLVPGADVAAALWLDRETGRLGPDDPIVPAAEATPDRLLLAMLQFAEAAPGGAYLPGRVDFADRHLARAMRPLLASLGIKARTASRLPELESALTSLEEYAAAEGSRAAHAALFAGGMDPPHLRAVALAAREFHHAAPWRRLEDEDLLHITAPTPPPGMAYAVVMGAAEVTYGVAFFPDRRTHEEVLAEDAPDTRRRPPEPGRRLSLTLRDGDELPLDVRQGYEQHGVPVIDESILPQFLFEDEDGLPRPPTPAEAAFLEGLLRALARSSVKQMDTGRWSVTVPTLDGPVTYDLELCYLLAPPSPATLRRWGERMDPRAMEAIPAYVQRHLEEHPDTSLEEIDTRLAALGGLPLPITPDQLGFGHPRNDRERAEDLYHEAVARHGYHRRALARRALALDPDCVPALTLLAEEDAAADPWPLLERAVAAGRQRLDLPALRQEPAGAWDHPRARPYLRALLSLAALSLETGRVDTTLAAAEELLELDPTDHLQARFALIQLYFSRGELEQAADLIANWPGRRGRRALPPGAPPPPGLSSPAEREDTLLAFLDTLLAYADPARRDREAPRLLREARRWNRHVLPLVLDDREPPRSVWRGKGADARYVAFYLRGLIPLVPGLREWLQERKRKR